MHFIGMLAVRALVRFDYLPAPIRFLVCVIVGGLAV
jgi:hypothetical protein